MSIENTCILVKLKISCWDGFKKDDFATETVDKFFHTEGRSGNFNKRLFAKSVLKPLRNVFNRVRAEHERMTMSWCYNGVHVLPNDLFFTYTETMRNCKDALDTVIDNFILQYPVYVSAQRNKLGDLFNSDDYPDPSFLREKYKLDIQFFPIPQAAHFPEASPEKLREELKANIEKTQTAALNELYEKIKLIVDRFHERLQDPTAVIRESLLDNLDALVSVLPGLNVFQDPKIDQIHQQLRDKVLVYNIKELREDMTKRRDAAVHSFDVAALLRG